MIRAAVSRMPKLYAVRKGFKPGVYRSWKECERQVKGFSGAVYKSFKTLAEATTFVETTPRKKFDFAGFKSTKSSMTTSSTSNSSMMTSRKTKDFDTARFMSTAKDTTLDSLDIYTDGSCRGNRNVREKQIKAGWGVVVLGKTKSKHVSVFQELWGPVPVKRSSPYFLGAEHGSNNTGELQAIGEALLWLRDHESTNKDATILSDSMYAMKTIKGEWQARKNVGLVKEVSRVLTDVRKDRNVRFEHVKGHSNHVWNDRADELANKGAHSTCTVGRYGNTLKKRKRQEKNEATSSSKRTKVVVSDDDDFEFEEDNEFLLDCVNFAKKVEEKERK